MDGLSKGLLDMGIEEREKAEKERQKELAGKLDAHENVRKGTKMRPSPANDGMTPKSESRNSSNHEIMPRMNRQYSIKNVQVIFLKLIVIK
ncbi:hypothetical protein TNCV_2407391 [Trichonephila clavipes]|nr:hypothetical protein TNCV_2407391 [Trichonephila clavipes]